MWNRLPTRNGVYHSKQEITRWQGAASPEPPVAVFNMLSAIALGGGSSSGGGFTRAGAGFQLNGGFWYDGIAGYRA